MSMKKSLVISALVTALSIASVSAAAAAPAAPGAVQSVPLLINQSEAVIRSVETGGAILYSLRDLGSAARVYLTVQGHAIVAWDGEHQVELKNASKAALKNGSSVTLQHPLTKIDQSYYIALEDFTMLFDAELELDGSGVVSVSTAKKLQGADRAVWIDAGRLLASQVTDEGRIDYIVDAASGIYGELMTSTDASDLVVAPNGKYAAYTLENGSVHLVNLITGAAKQLTADESIKTELVWAADSSAIYFLQGDKSSVIAKVSASGGAIAKLLEDKVDYKSNLSVSADGNSFYYTVVKPGEVKTDASAPVDEDNLTIDMTGTEPQIVYYDSSVEEAKPQVLTASADDKWLIGASADGSQAYYISIQDGQASKLIAIGKDKKATEWLKGKDVLYAVLAGDQLYAAVEENGEERVYAIQTATGSAELLYALPDSFTQLIAGPQSPLVVLTDNHVSINRNGYWSPIIN